MLSIKATLGLKFKGTQWLIYNMWTQIDFLIKIYSPMSPMAPTSLVVFVPNMKMRERFNICHSVCQSTFLVTRKSK